MKVSVVRHARLATMLTGSVIVAVWTVYRHITNGINFDVVGQIGLAQQWAHGLHGGAQLGATNYLLKMPLYALLNLFGFLSPMNRILLLALICNAATFLLLFVLFEKILKLYEVRTRSWFYVAMLWLASVAGSVYWTDYANSRNLETVGGILFIYLVLKFLKASSWQTATWIVVAGSIVFFADSLQFYVCGVGVCAYAAAYAVLSRKKSELTRSGSVIGVTLAAFIGSKFIGFVAERWLHVNFLVAPHQQLTVNGKMIVDTAQGLTRNTLDIFGADIFKRPYSLNTGREALSLLSLIGVMYLLVRIAPWLRKNTLFWVGLAVVIVNYGVYVASGQVLVWATSRYIVMIPLLFVIIVAIAGDRLKSRREWKCQLGWLALSLFSCLMLFGAVATHWSQRHTTDAPKYATVAFLQTQPSTYALSSRELGVTATYLDEDKVNVLPLLCKPDHTLVFTDLFYDRAAFERFTSYQGQVPLIVPGGGIVSGNSVCSASDIMAQFGQAQNQTSITGVGTVYLYPALQLQSKLPNSFEN